MAGEYKLAEQLLSEAMEAASSDAQMSEEGMAQALLVAVLSKMLASHTRKQLDDMIAYQLDNVGEDEFVVTRGG